jgi:hypothetical protein
MPDYRTVGGDNVLVKMTRSVVGVCSPRQGVADKIHRLSCDALTFMGHAPDWTNLSTAGPGRVFTFR